MEEAGQSDLSERECRYVSDLLIRVYMIYLLEHNLFKSKINTTIKQTSSSDFGVYWVESPGNKNNKNKLVSRALDSYTAWNRASSKR